MPPKNKNQKKRKRAGNTATKPTPPTKPAKFIYLALIAMALSACGVLFVLTQLNDPPIEKGSTRLAGRTMGTRFNIVYEPSDRVELSPNEMMAKISARLVEINSEMSTYEPESTISKFNRSTEINQPFEVSADFAELCQTAKQIHQATDGRYDVTVGPLVNLWGFGPTGSILRAPSDEAIEEVRQSVGADKFEIDTLGNTVSKSNPNTQIDLSSVAKGYGVDEIANLLGEFGVENFLVEIGGEIITAGSKSDGSHWTAAIELPNTTQERIPAVKIDLVNRALATSGNYRTFMEDAVTGIRYGHTIDPISGRPRLSTVLSVSVVAQRCALADARATALMASPAEKIQQIADREHWSMLAMVFNEDAGQSESKIKVVASKAFSANYPNVITELKENLDRLESQLFSETATE